MTPTTLYHNPRCSKSREALKLLQDAGESFVQINYLEQPPSQGTLSELVKTVDTGFAGMIRRKDLAKTGLSAADMPATPEEAVSLLAQHPELMERPLVVIDGQTIVARPPDKLVPLLGTGTTT